MSKIEEKLNISVPSDSMLLINALDDFYHESNMLFNNIYLSQTIFNLQKQKTFPLSYDQYDASWYKNLLISAEMLIDRFHYNISSSKDYSYLFNNVKDFDFLAFAKKWNTINYVVKFNLDDNMWKVKSAEWKISQTTIWLNEIVSMNIKYDKNAMDEISFNTSNYEPLAYAIGRNGFEEVINYILGKDNNKEETKKPINTQDMSNQQSQQHRTPEKEIDPRSPEGVSIEMDKLLEWVLLKQATMRAKNAIDRPEQKEISPLRKVMVELIEWCDKKEVITKTYQNNKKYGFDPYEYLDIINDLNKVRELRKELNQKVDACLEFATNNNPDVRLKPTKQIHRKYYKHIKLEEEKISLPSNKDLIKKLEKLNKELKLTTKQTKVKIALVNEEIEKLNNLLPDSEKVDLIAEMGDDIKEIENINNDKTLDEVKSSLITDEKNEANLSISKNDIKSTSSSEVGQTTTCKIHPQSDAPIKLKDTNEFKELIANTDINDFVDEQKNVNHIEELANKKIKLIDAELNKINKILLSNKKEIEHKKELPISNVKDEMDQLLIWMTIKVNECTEELKKIGYEVKWVDKNDFLIEKINHDVQEQNNIDSTKKEIVVKTKINNKNNSKSNNHELVPSKKQNTSKKSKVKKA